MINKNGNIEERYITVEESIKGSCKEIKEMRSGQAPKPSWGEFKEEMNHITGGVIQKDKEPIDISHTDYWDTEKAKEVSAKIMKQNYELYKDLENK